MGEECCVKEVLIKYSPGGHYGFDRDGRPVFIAPVGSCDIYGMIHSVKVDEFVDYGRERAKQGLKLSKIQEEKLGKVFNRATTLLLDAEGGSRKHLWRPGLQAFLAGVKMEETEFEGLRRRIIVVKTPFIFPIMYAIVKPFLRQETKDKIIILGKNWKMDILEYISPDNLPEFYGGTCQDENGCPKCEQYICYGGEIPKSYYVIDNVSKEDFKTKQLHAGEKFAVTKEINEVNKKVNYEFITSHHDIGFSVDFISHNGDKINVIPKERKACNIMMEKGVVECEKIGSYLFTFDNSFSWLRGKELFYLIQIVE